MKDPRQFKDPQKDDLQRRNRNFRNILVVIGVVVFALLLIQSFFSNDGSNNQITYTEFLNQVEADRIESVVIRGGTEIEGKYHSEFNGNETFKTRIPVQDDTLLARLSEKGISVEGEEARDPSWLLSVFISILPILLLVMIWIYMMRRMQGEGANALSFSRSQAKLANKEYPDVSFKDVAGIEEVKEEVSEIVDYLRNPKKFTEIGAQIPKGVLLVGSPGTGKTLLARAIAGEAKVPFFSISGSDFVEMFVGVGAARVRDLFRRAKEEARDQSGTIVFIDEIDAVGRKRGAGIGGGHDEREQTLNQLLSEMDGFEKNEHVIIIAATNRPDILDNALLRPGRFDRKIIVPVPDVRGREGILKVHVQGKKVSSEVDLNTLARRTPGFVGADLQNLCNEAALLAARRNRKEITMDDFEESIDRVIAGLERRSLIISEDVKEKIAFHEAGHTLVGLLMPKANPVHRVTIIPRGDALGYMLSVPEEDKFLQTKEELLQSITVTMGGRAAEELVFGEFTTGASNDLKQATQVAKGMVVSFGMSEAVGPVHLGSENGNVFLGQDLVLSKEHSEDMSALVDKEIKGIVEKCYAQARDLLKNNLDSLNKLARKLLEVETLDAEQLRTLLGPNVAQNVQLQGT